MVVFGLLLLFTASVVSQKSCQLYVACAEKFLEMRAESLALLEPVASQLPCPDATIKELEKVTARAKKDSLKCVTDLLKSKPHLLDANKAATCAKIVEKQEQSDGLRFRRAAKRFYPFLREAAKARQHNDKCERFKDCCPETELCAIKQFQSETQKKHIALQLQRFEAKQQCLASEVPHSNDEDWRVVETLEQLMYI